MPVMALLSTLEAKGRELPVLTYMYLPLNFKWLSFVYCKIVGPDLTKPFQQHVLFYYEGVLISP